MDDDNAALGFVFVGIFVAFVLSGLALVVGEVIRRGGASRGASVMIGVGAAVLISPIVALTPQALPSRPAFSQPAPHQMQLEDATPLALAAPLGPLDLVE